MTLAAVQPLQQDRRGSVELGEEDAAVVDAVGLAEHVTVGVLEGGAGDDGGVPGLGVVFHPVGEAAQPRPAVLVVERMPGRHLLLVGGRVEVIGLGVRETGDRGEALGDGGFSTGAHPHDHEVNGL